MCALALKNWFLSGCNSKFQKTTPFFPPISPVHRVTSFSIDALSCETFNTPLTTKPPKKRKRKNASTKRPSPLPSFHTKHTSRDTSPRGWKKKRRRGRRRRGEGRDHEALGGLGGLGGGTPVWERPVVRVAVVEAWRCRGEGGLGAGMGLMPLAVLVMAVALVVL